MFPLWKGKGGVLPAGDSNRQLEKCPGINAPREQERSQFEHRKNRKAEEIKTSIRNLSLVIRKATCLILSHLKLPYTHQSMTK